MKRRGQEAGLHFSFAALRIDKEEAVEELDFAGGADAAVEIVEVGAAAQSDIVAIIHVFAAQQHVGSCAAADGRTLFGHTSTPSGVTPPEAARPSPDATP